MNQTQYKPSCVINPLRWSIENKEPQPFKIAFELCFLLSFLIKCYFFEILNSISLSKQISIVSITVFNYKSLRDDIFIYYLIQFCTLADQLYTLTIPTMSPAQIYTLNASMCMRPQASTIHNCPILPCLIHGISNSQCFTNIHRTFEP